MEMLFSSTKHIFVQIYAEMIGNVMTDARSTGKYYHCTNNALQFLVSDVLISIYYALKLFYLFDGFKYNYYYICY